MPRVWSDSNTQLRGTLVTSCSVCCSVLVPLPTPVSLTRTLERIMWSVKRYSPSLASCRQWFDSLCLGSYPHFPSRPYTHVGDPKYHRLPVSTNCCRIGWTDDACRTFLPSQPAFLSLSFSRSHTICCLNKQQLIKITLIVLQIL